MLTARLKVGLDTSCLVALFVEDHTFHHATLAGLERLRGSKAHFVVPCHVLLECFSVLTRMPSPHRHPPEAVERLLLDNFATDAEIPGIDRDLTWSTIRDLAAAGLIGGQVYDAVIAQSTFAAGAGVLLTWNVHDFARLAPGGLEILTPAEYAARGPRVH